MFVNRKSPRYDSMARVKIPRAIHGDALLKNLSITGACIESTNVIEMVNNEIYTLEVYPEENSGIGRFDLVGRAQWMVKMGYASEVGLLITEFPHGKQFMRYVDFLAKHNGSEHSSS